METKPVIITITGESGVGKTTLAEYICKKYGYNFIQSYTDRPRRTPDEIGHTFLTPEEFSNIKPEDMIAFTKFGNYRYCCCHKDVKTDVVNVYVIDEVGVIYLKKHFSGLYDIKTIRLHRPLKQRLQYAGEERVNRDKGMFKKPHKYYDIHIYNWSDLARLYWEADFYMQIINMIVRYRR